MSKQLAVKIKGLRQGARVPTYGTLEAAGSDLYSPVTVTIAPKSYKMIPSGLAFEIPKGWEMQCRPRSGLANKHLLIIPNSPGTVDSDYRGEVKVGLYNLSDKPYTIQKGDRICQLVFQEVTQAEFEVVVELSDTERGSGGFGSTGV